MSNKKKGKIVKEEKDNKQEEILKLEIENSEEIDEKEFEKAKRKYEERMKLPFGIKKGIYVKILKELIIPVVMVVLFTLTYILKEVLNFITINVFVLILGTLSIAIYEFSYRKSKEEYFIKNRLGSSLFSLHATELDLAFVGAGDKVSQEAIDIISSASTSLKQTIISWLKYRNDKGKLSNKTLEKAIAYIKQAKI